MNNPFVSVIIPTADRPQLLRQTLVSCLAQSFAAEAYEVIVVDNGKNTDAHQVVQDLSDSSPVSLHYVRESRSGLHFARHAGAEAARGHILLYADDDIIASPDWVQGIFQAYDCANVGAVGGRVLGRWEGPIPEWVYAVGDSHNCGPLSLLDFGDDTFDLPPGQVVYGCNLSVRADVLRKVGGFNPDGFPKHLLEYRGDGESGLLSKVRQAGYVVRYCGRAQVEHVVTVERLRFSYALDRLFRQGISRGFTRARELGGRRLPLMIDGILCIFLGMGHVIAQMFSTHSLGQLRHQLRRKYLLSRGRHELRIAVKPSLHRYVLRSSFWDRPA